MPPKRPAAWWETSLRADRGGTVQLVMGDLRQGPPASAPAVRNGLPAAPVVLAGRTDEVEELLKALAPGGPPALVVAGLAGVGKSALALAVAQQAMKEGLFEGGVLFVELHGYDPGGGLVGAGQAVDTLLGQLGIQGEDLPATAQARLALFRSELAARSEAGLRVLIVADDAGDVGQVRDLVPPGEAHQLLVTSRERLVAPDFLVRVLALDELPPEAAVELITAALRHNPGDTRAEREPEALEEIAGHCGRLPLALMVAAATLAGDPGLAPRALARQLADARIRLEALSPPDRGGLPTGVRAAFDLSYQRLPEDQARLLRLLTVVPGPDCPGPLAAVFTEKGGSPTENRPLAALSRAGLLQEHPLGSDRWRMHDLVRLYATWRGELSAEADDRVAAAARVLEIRRGLLWAADSQVFEHGGPPEVPLFPNADAALAWLDAESPGLIASARLVAVEERLQDTIWFGLGVFKYLDRRNRWGEALELLEPALAAARQTGDREAESQLLSFKVRALTVLWRPEEALRTQERLVAMDREDGDDPPRTAVLLGIWARLLSRTGRPEEALEQHKAALDLLDGRGLPAQEAAQLDELGQTLRRLGRTTEAIAAMSRAVLLFAEAGENGHAMARVTANLGKALSEAGQHEAAVAVHEAALAAFQELGDERHEAASWGSLGDALRLLGRYTEAVAALTRSREVFREAGIVHDEGFACAHLGAALAGAGRPAEALPVLERAGELLGETDDRGLLGWSLYLLGEALAQLKRYDEAVPALERAAALQAEAGDAGRREITLALLASVRAELARPPGRRWWPWGRSG
ncbi:tetratricopeptide repeat protein [Streptomyces goshikiensis]|uniref:tetratricopeptide repeat protein n=1 Tax=Streptomyces goshikiensis TaxID=1942 RepID=UPI0036C1190E